MLRIGILLVVLFCSVLALGQKYPLVTYSTEQGLPQSQVTSLTQDENGYLWIGTLGGLAKFGGTKFMTYSTKDGLLNNRISALEYFDDKLWVGHDGGITYMINNQFKSVEFEGDGNDRSRKVSKIIKFKDKILVCSIKGGLFELRNDKLEKIELDDINYDWIRGAYIYKDKLFLATRKGIIASDDAKHFTMLSEFGEYSYSGIAGWGGEMVCSTFKEGVFIKNMVTGRLEYIEQETLIHKAQGCFIDRDGLIWLNTLHGAIRLDKERGISFFDEDNGLPVNTISCFLHDNADNIWIGSLGKGVFRFPSSDFRYYDQSTGFPSDLFLGGFQDKQGDYYFATFDKGVVKRTQEGKMEYPIEQEIAIWASLDDLDGKHWFGAKGYLAEVSMSGSVKIHSDVDNDQIPGWKITALYRISDNSMYVGGNRGVAIYKDGKFKKLGTTEIGTVRDFAIYQGVTYCATNLGLYTYQNGEFNIVQDVNAVVYNIEVDNNGGLWFGTEEGLFRLKNGQVKKFELLPDPGSNFIVFMNFRDGQLFIGTNNGLFVVSNLGSDQLKVKRFGTWDGVVDLETNLNSGFFDQEGDFWFGTASGLVRYRPNSDEGKNARPNVNFVSILLNYEAFDYTKFSEEILPNGLPKSLTLPYSRNNIIFELDAVSFEHQKGLGYQFWLEGLNDTWSPLSESPTITFTSLPAGSYVLHVKSVDLEGRSSDELTFPFTINAPYYQTWWFILLVAVVVLLSVLMIFRFRIRRIAQSNEQEKLVYKSRLLALEQKSMNASMNRHFIFNSLNSIQYFINTQDRLSANKYLTNFAKLIRKNLDSATAEGNVITLEEELERLELYLSLEAMRFKGRFDYKIEVKDVDTESVLIPAMLMQPFIENSIIHGILPDESKKGQITIDVRITDDYLNILIEDNGIGIHQSLSRKLTADGDHRSQGMEITSKRIELIQKILKNGISLEGPEEIVDENGSINGTYVLIKIPISNLEI